MDRSTVVLGGVAVSAVAALLFAGPLTPPAGPIASTYKTLHEVEPRIVINATNTPGNVNGTFVITQPGSYYLTGNVTGEVGKHGILIGSDGVTVDLNGFTLTGVPGAFSGVGHSVSSYRNVTVRNGTATGWANGVAITGAGNRVEGVRASENVGNGILLSTNGIIESCTASDNGTNGISVGNGCVVRGCTSYLNDGTGVAGSGSTAVSDCNAYSNATGFNLGLGSTIIGCSARDNTADGFVVSSASVVSNCSAYSNTGDGIRAASTSVTISGCTASFNSADGIEVPGNCHVINNICDSNGVGAGVGMGIKATGTDSRIEGNSLMRNDFGMDVQLSGNFIVRNSAAGNTTNYQIIANNKVGTIVSAPNSLAINGSTGGAGVGSTDPWANFSY